MHCLHPNQDNPTCWRLQIKALRVQEYFPFAKYGNKEAAFLALIKREEVLNKRLKAKKLRSEIPFNMMFDQETGGLRGTSFTCNTRRGQLVKMQATVNGKQKGTSRKVSSDELWNIFLELAAWRMTNLDIAPSREIKSHFKRSFKHFEEKFREFKMGIN